MKITELIKNRARKFLGIENGAQRMYESDLENLRTYQVMENRAYYIGDSNKIRWFYTNSQWAGVIANNPLYNMNRRNYFSTIVANEQAKMVHSGLPRAIVDTMCAVMGMPTVSVEGIDSEELDRLRKETKVDRIIYKQQMPLTLAEGWGALKVNMSTKYKKYPTLEFYEAKDVDFIVRDGVTVGIIYRDYYSARNRDYVLMETRRLDGEGNSLIEYELFEMRATNLIPVPLDTVPELAGLENVRIGYDRILGIPCRLVYDPDNPDYGQSIYAGRIDLFDDLDQSLSVRSQTCKVSPPIEYVPVEFIKRGKDGQSGLPHVYNRQMVDIPAIADGDGNINARITTSQPTLNFEQYTAEEMALTNQILIGLLSPATMGIDLSRRDNAEAQREKEKVTEMTRNNLIVPQGDIIRDTYALLLDAKDIMDGRSPREWKVDVTYSQFSSPSFEGKAKALVPLFNSEAISDEMFVDKLYGDQLSREQKEEEVARIREKRNTDKSGILDDLMKQDRNPDEDRI